MALGGTTDGPGTKTRDHWWPQKRAKDTIEKGPDERLVRQEGFLGQGTSAPYHFRLVPIAVDRPSTPETLFRPQPACPYSQAPVKLCWEEHVIGSWCGRVSLPRNRLPRC